MPNALSHLVSEPLGPHVAQSASVHLRSALPKRHIDFVHPDGSEPSMLLSQSRPTPISLVGVAPLEGYLDGAGLELHADSWCEREWKSRASVFADMLDASGDFGGEMGYTMATVVDGVDLSIQLAASVVRGNRPGKPRVPARVRVNVDTREPQAEHAPLVFSVFDQIMQTIGIRGHLEWTNDQAFRRYKLRDNAPRWLSILGEGCASNGPVFHRYLQSMIYAGWSTWQDAFAAIETYRNSVAFAPLTMKTRLGTEWREYPILRKKVYGMFAPVVASQSAAIRLICDPFANRESCPPGTIWVPLLFWSHRRRTQQGVDDHEVLCAALLDKPGTVELEFVSDDEPPDVLSKFVKKHTGLELRHFPVEEIIARGL